MSMSLFFMICHFINLSDINMEDFYEKGSGKLPMDTTKVQTDNISIRLIVASIVTSD